MNPHVPAPLAQFCFLPVIGGEVDSEVPGGKFGHQVAKRMVEAFRQAADLWPPGYAAPDPADVFGDADGRAITGIDVDVLLARHHSLRRQPIGEIRDDLGLLADHLGLGVFRKPGRVDLRCQVCRKDEKAAHAAFPCAAAAASAFSRFFSSFRSWQVILKRCRIFFSGYCRCRWHRSHCVPLEITYEQAFKCGVSPSLKLVTVTFSPSHANVVPTTRRAGVTLPPTTAGAKK